MATVPVRKTLLQYRLLRAWWGRPLELAGIGSNQPRAAAGLPATGSMPQGNHPFAAVLWSGEEGNSTADFAATCWGKKLKHGLTAQIGKDNLSFSILAIKTAKIVSNMQIKHHIPEAGNWVTLYLNTRNERALTADEAFLLHK